MPLKNKVFTPKLLDGSALKINWTLFLLPDKEGNSFFPEIQGIYLLTVTG